MHCLSLADLGLIIWLLCTKTTTIQTISLCNLPYCFFGIGVVKCHCKEGTTSSGVARIKKIGVLTMTDLLTMLNEAVYNCNRATTEEERAHWALVVLELELELVVEGGC